MHHHVRQRAERGATRAVAAVVAAISASQSSLRASSGSAAKRVKRSRSHASIPRKRALRIPPATCTLAHRRMEAREHAGRRARGCLVAPIGHAFDVREHGRKAAAGRAHDRRAVGGAQRRDDLAHPLGRVRDDGVLEPDRRPRHVQAAVAAHHVAARARVDPRDRVRPAALERHDLRAVDVDPERRREGERVRRVQRARAISASIRSRNQSPAAVASAGTSGAGEGRKRAISQRMASDPAPK